MVIKQTKNDTANQNHKITGTPIKNLLCICVGNVVVKIATNAKNTGKKTQLISKRIGKAVLPFDILDITEILCMKKIRVLSPSFG